VSAPTASSPQAKATKVWLWIAVPIALICAVIWLASLRERYYVRAMYGPYQGLEFSGDLPPAAESELKLKSGERLSVYVVPDARAPVLVLWSAAGERRWKRLMVPIHRYSNGSVKEAWLRELRLHALRRSRDGIVVDITCEWELGGHEGGRLYLDDHLDFREFKLSW